MENGNLHFSVHITNTAHPFSPSRKRSIAYHNILLFFFVKVFYYLYCFFFHTSPQRILDGVSQKQNQGEIHEQQNNRTTLWRVGFGAILLYPDLTIGGCRRRVMHKKKEFAGTAPCASSAFKALVARNMDGELVIKTKPVSLHCSMPRLRGSKAALCRLEYERSCGMGGEGVARDARNGEAAIMEALSNPFKAKHTRNAYIPCLRPRG